MPETYKVMEYTNINQAGRAPIATLSNVAPSLDSLPQTQETSFIVPMDRNIKANEVKLQDKSLTSSSMDDDDDDPKIPDGGWGWVVVAATFFLCMIADGVTFSFGLLYVEFLKEFGASNSATSWIGSLFMAVPLMSGPIMSALVDKYGCRIMTMIGGVISATGFVISSKCHSLSLMYLTFGVISGLGLGIMYVTIVVSVAFWFDKKRNMAVGISSSGIGIGTFVFSPLTTFLINEYSWRGTTLILAGCFLNMSVCGALMRDPDWIIEQNRKTSKSDLHKSEKNGKEGSASEDQFNAIDIDELKVFLTSDKDATDLWQNLESNLGESEDKDKLKTYFNSVLHLPTYIRDHKTVPVEVLQLLSNNKNVYNIILKKYPSLVLSKSTSVSNDVQKLRDETNIENDAEMTARMRSSSVHQNLEPERQALIGRQNSRTYHEKYFKNLKLDTHSLVHRGAFNTNKYKLKASSCPNIYKVSMVSKSKEREEKWYSEAVDLIKGMFDYSLFLELHFLLLSFSTITLFVWFIVPYFYLAELMLKNGYTAEDASFTISNIGISNTVGMLLLGWAGDRPWMNITKSCGILLVICGLSISGLMFFVNNFIVLEICASLFGITLSCHFAFTPGIVVELIPLERFTLAYGLQLLCQGIGTLLGPPYAGLLFDVTGSWEQSFYQAAIWIVLSGIFIGIIPYTKNRRIIGKGPVEKVTEQTDQIIALVLLIVSMLALGAFVFYLTGISFF